MIGLQVHRQTSHEIHFNDGLQVVQWLLPLRSIVEGHYALGCLLGQLDSVVLRVDGHRHFHCVYRKGKVKDGLDLDCNGVWVMGWSAR